MAKKPNTKQQQQATGQQTNTQQQATGQSVHANSQTNGINWNTFDPQKVYENCAKMVSFPDESKAKEICQKYQDCMTYKDTGDAQRLSELFNGQYKFDWASGTWYLYSQHYWNEDKKNEILNVAFDKLKDDYKSAFFLIQLLLGTYPQLNSEYCTLKDEIRKRISQIGGTLKKSNIVRSTATLPTVAITSEDWNKNNHLIAVGNGVLDLRTAELVQDTKPDDYIKGCIPTIYRGKDIKCPMFDSFMNDMFCGDEEIIRCIQRFLGYGLMGNPKEQKFLILHGRKGRNGKGTLYRTITHVLGTDIVANPRAEILLTYSQKGDATSPTLMSLEGKRLALIGESQHRDIVNLALVKNITGNDPISGHRKYKDPTEYIPIFVPILATNHLPIVEEDDNAFWQRLVLIPLRGYFGDDADPSNLFEKLQDSDLTEKLKTESSGILAWLVRGCLDYQKNGLMIPQSVRDNLNNYRDDEKGPVFKFIEDKCVLDPQASTPGADLHNSYVQWCGIPQITTGYTFDEAYMSQKTFYRKLDLMPFLTKGKGRTGVFFAGIKIK